jgi:hypothetical protein
MDYRVERMKGLICSVAEELDCGCDETIRLDDLLVCLLIGPHVAATIDPHRRTLTDASRWC